MGGNCYFIEMGITEQLKSEIRDVADFPKEGILFKDITPVLSNPDLTKAINLELSNYWKNQRIEAVLGIESRGFLFGMSLATNLEVPFIPVRKAGKLPYKTHRYSYDLEYGSAEVEIHIDALQKDQRVVIHDDLLATGGTANAASQLVECAVPKLLDIRLL